MLFHPWRRPKREADLEQEIQSHLEMAARDHFERGETAEKARADARREFGKVGLVKETTRAMLGWVWLEQLSQDLRYVLRMLSRSPGFTTVAVLSLGLGIGANTAIFSMIDALMLRSLPVSSPEQLVMFFESAPDTPVPETITTSYRSFEKYRDLTDVFEGVSAVCMTDRSNVTVPGPGGGSDSAPVRIGMVSGNYFSMLGIPAFIGRTLTTDDDRVPGSHAVAAISYGYWERRLAHDSDVIGRTLSLNSTSYTIVGVTPPGFAGDWVGRPADVWIPAMMQAQVMPEYPNLLTRDGSWLRLLARLKPGVAIQQAQAAAQVVYRQGYEEFWRNPTPQQAQFMELARVELKPAAGGYSPERQSYSQSLWILTIVAGLVLLIACANIANVLLARSAARRREIAVRLAVGAGRARIIRQLLTESVLLAATGSGLGLLLSMWGTKVMATAVGSGPVQMDSRGPSQWISLDLSLDWRVFAFTGALCLFTGILFGLAPAFRSSNVSLSPALTGRGMSGEAGGRFGLNKLLVISQVAMSLVLLIAAGLLVRTLRNLKGQELGFDRQQLLLVWTAPGRTGRQGPALADFCHSLLERISGLPGVLSASAANHGLLEGWDRGGSSELTIVEGQEPKPGLTMLRNAVAGRFFETVGTPLLAGRDFTEQDNERAPKVALINETMARFFFGDQDPIGRRFGHPGDMQEIVGVVADAKHGTPRDSRGVWYVPYRQSIGLMRSMCVVVRAARSPASLPGEVRRELRDIDPNLPILKIDTIEEQLSDVLVQERLIASLSGFFGTLAALLACLGLYGVISYTVARRTNEIGIRLALGATHSGVLRMILGESLVLVVAGIAISVPVALASGRLISARLFGVSPTDPLTIVTASVLMIAVATLAGFIPARRASRVDPMVALRYE